MFSILSDIKILCRHVPKSEPLTTPPQNVFNSLKNKSPLTYKFIWKIIIIIFVFILARFGHSRPFPFHKSFLCLMLCSSSSLSSYFWPLLPLSIYALHSWQAFSPVLSVLGNNFLTYWFNVISSLVQFSLLISSLLILSSILQPWTFVYKLYFYQLNLILK